MAMGSMYIYIESIDILGRLKWHPFIISSLLDHYIRHTVLVDNFI